LRREIGSGSSDPPSTRASSRPTTSRAP